MNNENMSSASAVVTGLSFLRRSVQDINSVCVGGGVNKLQLIHYPRSHLKIGSLLRHSIQRRGLCLMFVCPCITVTIIYTAN